MANEYTEWFVFMRSENIRMTFYRCWHPDLEILLDFLLRLEAYNQTSHIALFHPGPTHATGGLSKSLNHSFAVGTGADPLDLVIVNTQAIEAAPKS